MKQGSWIWVSGAAQGTAMDDRTTQAVRRLPCETYEALRANLDLFPQNRSRRFSRTSPPTRPSPLLSYRRLLLPFLSTSIVPCPAPSATNSLPAPAERNVPPPPPFRILTSPIQRARRSAKCATRTSVPKRFSPVHHLRQNELALARRRPRLGGPLSRSRMEKDARAVLRRARKCGLVVAQDGRTSSRSVSRRSNSGRARPHRSGRGRTAVAVAVGAGVAVVVGSRQRQCETGRGTFARGCQDEPSPPLRCLASRDSRPLTLGLLRRRRRLNSKDRR